MSDCWTPVWIVGVSAAWFLIVVLVELWIAKVDDDE